ncbi:phage holin family protein [Bacteroidales bacterium OttesenSCG-928-I21]|nr:phage holin family protein [Bacteroidales bacterium OttesenSCG-928-I21]
MKATITEFIQKYGFMLVIGVIAAVINRLRRNMSWKRFIASIVISVFVSLCVGVIATEYFKFNPPLVYVCCGVFGTFSEIILDEIHEFIQQISDVVIKIIEKK